MSVNVHVGLMEIGVKFRFCIVLMPHLNYVPSMYVPHPTVDVTTFRVVCCLTTVHVYVDRVHGVTTKQLGRVVVIFHVFHLFVRPVIGIRLHRIHWDIVSQSMNVKSTMVGVTH